MELPSFAVPHKLLGAPLANKPRHHAPQVVIMQSARHPRQPAWVTIRAVPPVKTGRPPKLALASCFMECLSRTSVLYGECVGVFVSAVWWVLVWGRYPR